MPLESSTKSGQSPPAEGDKYKQLDREIKEMVSTIAHSVNDFHKSGSTDHLEKEEDEHETRIITLAGTNDGATLRSELDEKSGKTSLGESEALSTFVNSNFQAINNSIMLGGSYQANDPGVHLDISDFTDQPSQSYPHKAEKVGKKVKKKEKEASKSEHQFSD